MRSSLPRKKIIEYFDKFDGRFTIIVFNSDTETRIFTYSGLNIYNAFEKLNYQNNLNRLVRIYIDLPSMYMIAKTLSQIPPMYQWNPDPYNEFRRK